MPSYELSATAVLVLGQVAASPGRLTASAIAAVGPVPSSTLADAVEELLAAGLVQVLADGRLTTLPPPVLGPDERGAPGQPAALPAAQHEVLVLLALGMKDEAIARRLDVSTRTVRRTISALMADCGADSRFQLAVEAFRRGWLSTEELAGPPTPLEPQP